MKVYSSANVTVTQNQAYDLILSPMITEKSTLGAENNQVTFRVPLTASKPEIKAAVELLFDVKVKAVNTLRQKGKVKRFQGRMGKRSDFKKAVICLEEGHSIDVGIGV
jgi:large subunit ribosomal protein L23